MKRFVTGLDPDGRSTIVCGEDVTALEIAPPPGAAEFGEIQFRRFELWTNGNPVKLAHAVTPDSNDPTFLELGLGPGETGWNLWQFVPNFSAPQHRTHSIDHDTVVAGRMDILMEDGSTASMSAGDSVVVTGVRHGWRAGPEGCTMVTFFVGLDRR